MHSFRQATQHLGFYPDHFSYKTTEHGGYDSDSKDTVSQRAQQRHHKVFCTEEVGTTQGHLRSFGMDLLPDLIKYTDWGSALFELHDAALGTYKHEVYSMNS